MQHFNVDDRAGCVVVPQLGIRIVNDAIDSFDECLEFHFVKLYSKWLRMQQCLSSSSPENCDYSYCTNPCVVA